MRTFHCNRLAMIVAGAALGIVSSAVAGATLGSASPTQSPQISSSNSGSASMYFNRLVDLARRLKKLADEGRKKLADGITTPEEKAYVLGLLDDLEAEIDTLLDPTTDPSLDQVGSVLPEFVPMSLEDHADQTAWLAGAAEAEAELADPDHFMIGSYVLTIEFWLDDYRQAVLDL